MSKDCEKNKKHSIIDIISKRLYGYDDATLQREMDEAEADWEQQKEANPAAESQSLEEAQSNFKVMMEKIAEQEIKPVIKPDSQEDRPKVIRWKRFLKMGILAAALCLLLLGLAIEGVAFKKFGYRQENLGTVKNKVIWNDDQYQIRVDDLEDAYQEIKDKMGITVVVLGYKPEVMKFNGVFIDKGNARIMFGDGENIVYLRQTMYQAENVSAGAISDQESSFSVFNLAFNREIIVKENKLLNGKAEYWAEFNMDGAYYYIVGIIDEEEFVKIVECLDYYE